MTATLDSRTIGARAAWRPAAWVGTTPAWLLTTMAVVCALAVAAGLTGALTVGSRTHALAAARHVAEPLVVDAETAVVDLSDANTTMAGGFLAGSVIPAAAQTHFSGDLAQAAAALTAASQRAGTGPQITGLLQSLQLNLPVYSGIVATAEADYRQGEPVAAAYLAEANHLMSSQLLPAASALYAAEEARLSEDNARATHWPGELLLLALLGALVGVLVYTQVRLARRFHRLFNPPALIATVAATALAIWVIVALASEGSAVARSSQVGSGPLGALTQARILDGQARADDELTLVTRDSDPGYQQDYGAVSARLTTMLDQSVPGWTRREATSLASGAQQWSAYRDSHARVRQADSSGRLSAAVVADATSSASDARQLDAALAEGIDTSVASFSASARAAADDLDGLLWAALILMAVVVAGVIFGLEPRLKEYR
jgi:hypothetical protein